MIDLGGDLPGVVIGEALAVGGAFSAQWWATKRARDLFVLEAQEARDTRLAQWQREDLIATRERQELVMERLWERRAAAYDSLLSTLSLIQRNAQIAMDSALNGGDPEAFIERETAMSHVQEGLELLRGHNLYLSDQTVETLTDFHNQISMVVLSIRSNTERDTTMQRAVKLVNLSRTSAAAIRYQGRLYLGERQTLRETAAATGEETGPGG